MSRVARNPVHAEARGGRPLEYEVAGVSVLKGGGARSVGRTVRSIASGRSGARVSSWLRDFVGTGRSAETGLRELNDAIDHIVRARDIKVGFATAVAFHVGWQRVQAVAGEPRLGLELHSCELLEEGSRLFGPKSKAFPDPEQRGRARELARAQGVLLEKNWPLGYGGLELGVVFERGCPNSTVPILWAGSSSPKWMPLFKRA